MLHGGVGKADSVTKLLVEWGVQKIITVEAGSVIVDAMRIVKEMNPSLD